MDDHEEASNAETAHSEAEELLVRRLTEKTPEGNDPDVDALKALPPRWEVRIQTERDPVEEETKAYRAIAREVDDRYDKYDKGQSR
ncbi:hypothetical protein [Cohnella silvisoli]|uniref:Uncharacterized protein n=1 Tax=Cohnella silvisoli TaxID=2873699 RepID=A0ABV1KQY8_9BACL|nr:hypothetical protein [Cohnella silvisoli]MCD9024556.1 hypothetical protein [Cohnella silvisoli]